MSIRKNIAGLVLASTVAVGAITQYEGFRSVAYLDIAGVPTVGYGSTEGVKLGDTIDERTARTRLIKEVNDVYGRGVRDCVKVPLHQSEYDAYLSLTYNIGVSAFCKSTLVRLLNRGNYEAACEQIKRWNRAGGKVSKGLTNRRKGEYNMCVSDHNPHGEIENG